MQRSRFRNGSMPMLLAVLALVGACGTHSTHTQHPVFQGDINALTKARSIGPMLQQEAARERHEINRETGTKPSPGQAAPSSP